MYRALFILVHVGLMMFFTGSCCRSILLACLNGSGSSAQQPNGNENQNQASLKPPEWVIIMLWIHKNHNLLKPTKRVITKPYKYFRLFRSHKQRNARAPVPTSGAVSMTLHLGLTALVARAIPEDIPPPDTGTTTASKSFTWSNRRRNSRLYWRLDFDLAGDLNKSRPIRDSYYAYILVRENIIRYNA